MSAKRGVSQDELLMWIEEDGDEAVLSDIGRRLSHDPELETWAQGARGDRRTIGALGARDARRAPRGVWQDAVAEAERRALLIENEIEPVRGPYRLRVTPVRLGIAAALLMVVSLGTIAPLILGPSSSGPSAAAPGVEEAAPMPGAAPDLAADFALGDSARSGRSLEQGVAESRRRESAAPTVTLASFADGWAADSNGLVAGRAMAGYGFGNARALAPKRRALPGAFPESWGMSRERARRLANEGRLVARVKAEDVDAYIARLRGAMGRRATLEQGGLASDMNGVAAPAELVLHAPLDKLERALRLCAVDAQSIVLGAAPASGRPGAWAESATWWAGGDGRADIRLIVEPVGGAGF